MTENTRQEKGLPIIEIRRKDTGLTYPLCMTREERRKKKLQKRKKLKRELKKRELATWALLLASMCVVGLYADKNFAGEEKPQVKAKEEEEAAKKPVRELSPEEINQIKEEARRAGCPEEVIRLSDKNIETMELIRDYPEKKDAPFAKTVDEPLQAGRIPAFFQWDSRWGLAGYGTSTIAESGCGPTSLAMVVAGLTGNQGVTPYTMAGYSQAGGYLDESNNTYWRFMTEAAASWGVKSREGMLGEAGVAAELSQGNPIICSVGAGDFTDGGHFIVLTGYQDGVVTVNDPFSRENTQKTWVYSQIAGQIREMWVYSR